MEGATPWDEGGSEKGELGSRGDTVKTGLDVTKQRDV